MYENSVAVASDSGVFSLYEFRSVPFGGAIGAAVECDLCRCDLRSVPLELRSAPRRDFSECEYNWCFYSLLDFGICCSVSSCTGMVSIGVLSSKKKQEAFIRFLGLPSKMCDAVGFWVLSGVVSLSAGAVCVFSFLMDFVGIVVGM